MIKKKRPFTFSPPLIAHRGASFYAPENTMIAFQKAVSFGARWIECDVMLTKDQVPIIFHDDTLMRTTNGHGAVQDFSYAYLRTLDAGSWFQPWFADERIPTLMEALRFFKEMGVSLNLEIKPTPHQDEQTAALVASVVEAMPFDLDRILFSSFSRPALRVLKAVLPNASTGLLLADWQPDFLHVCETLGCVSLHLDEAQLTEARIQAVKETGLQLLAYTVNSKARARALVQMGVDAVFSDLLHSL